MKKILVCLLTLVMMMSLCACGSKNGGGSGKGAKALTAADFEGTWVLKNDEREEKITFKSDMTYHREITLLTPPVVSSSSDETYSVSGNELTIDYHIEGENYPGTFKITINGNEMKWESKTGSIDTYTKQ